MSVTLRTSRPLVLLLAACLLSCGRAPSPPSGAPAVLPAPTPQVVLPAVSTPRGVRFLDGPPPVRACQEEDANRCTAGYQAFLEHPTVAALAQPVDCGALARELEGYARAGLVPWPNHPGPHPDLGRAVAAATGLGPLLQPEHLDRTALTVRVLSEVVQRAPDGSTYTEQRWLIESELVGQIPALYLRPAGPGPVPAVLALPGHGETAADHRDRRFARYLPGHGYAVLLITPRAYELELDHELSLAFLCQGFSLMGLRVYEGLLALRALRALQEVDGARVAVQGHSGGSAAANLMAWLPWRPAAAYLVDARSTYSMIWVPQGEDVWRLECEAKQELAAIHRQVNELDAAPVPVALLGYGYGPPTDDPDDVDIAPDDPAALGRIVEALHRMLGD